MALINRSYRRPTVAAGSVMTDDACTGCVALVGPWGASAQDAVGRLTRRPHSADKTAGRKNFMSCTVSKALRVGA